MRRIFLLPVLAAAVTLTATAQMRGIGFRTAPGSGFSARWSSAALPNLVHRSTGFRGNFFNRPNLGNPALIGGFLKNSNCFQRPFTCEALFGSTGGFWDGYSPYGYGYGYGPAAYLNGDEPIPDSAARLQQTNDDLQDLIRQERLLQMRREQDAVDATLAGRSVLLTNTPPHAQSQPPEAQAAPSAETYSQPPAILVFRDEQELEVRNYVIAGNVLYNLDPDIPRRISLTDLDVPATMQKNEARGVSFRLPSSRK